MVTRSSILLYNNIQHKPQVNPDYTTEYIKEPKKTGCFPNAFFLMLNTILVSYIYITESFMLWISPKIY